MLDLMRRHARSWLIKVALGGIIIVFIFWYGWSGPGDKSQTYAARVNGVVISYDQFYNVYESELEKIRLRFGGALPPELMQKVNLKKSVITGLVHQVLMLQEATRLGMFVTDEDLARDVKSNPQFQRDGVFDPNMYRMYLQSIKLTPAMYEQTRKQELLEEQLIRLLTDSIKTDPEEIKRWWHFQNDKVVLSALLIKPEVKETKEIDQKALESFFRKNEKKYEIPESLNLKYVVFSAADLEKKIDVTEDEIHDYFVMHPKDFIVPEKVHIEVILLKTPEGGDQKAADEVKAKAADLLKRIRAGEDFEALARAESQDKTSAEKGGDLGFIARGSLAPELEEAAFKTEVGSVSEPVKTKQGYYLIKVVEKQPEVARPYEDVHGEIKAKLLETKARKQLPEVAEDFYEQVYRTEDLEGQAKKFGFPVWEQNFVSRKGALEHVGSDPEIIEDAFRLKTGEVSKMVKTGDAYVVTKLISRNKARMPSLEEVRDQVVKDYLADQARLEAENKADAIIKALKESPDKANEMISQMGLKWENLDPVSRTAGFVPTLGNSSDVTEMLSVISMESPIFARPIVVEDGAAAVVKLTGVEKASEEQFKKDAAAFESWVSEVRKTEFLKGWIKLLEDRSKIEINDKLM
ncbi:MAG: SurA N-terminal domain-containing protein [Desulfomonilaceae bacterium]